MFSRWPTTSWSVTLASWTARARSWYRGDVGIRGDVIAAIGPSIGTTAGRTIDAAGNVVSPGFIDTHTHAQRGIFEVPTADNYVRQGVTTVIEGPDGSSPVPLGPFLAKLDALRKSVNIGSFIGQGSIRSAVIGDSNRTATPDEIGRMKALVEQGMTDGAFGMSTGLFYVPGTFTPTAEVVELAKVAGRFGGIHTSHQRDETAKVVESVRETIAIGEEGGLPTQVTHHKIIGKENWGRSAETLKLIDDARARGVDVTSDQYPVHRVEHQHCLGTASRMGTRRWTTADTRAAEGSGDAGEGKNRQRGDDPRRTRRRRCKERPAGQLRVRRRPRRQDPGGRRQRARHGTDN